LQKTWSHTRCFTSLPRKFWKKTNEEITCPWCLCMAKPLSYKDLMGQGGDVQ
jgi:hypothetical protein